MKKLTCYQYFLSNSGSPKYYFNEINIHLTKTTSPETGATLLSSYSNIA